MRRHEPLEVEISNERIQELQGGLVRSTLFFSDLSHRYEMFRNATQGTRAVANVFHRIARVDPFSSQSADAMG
jgi:hypothetical protein